MKKWTLKHLLLFYLWCASIWLLTSYIYYDSPISNTVIKLWYYISTWEWKEIKSWRYYLIKDDKHKDWFKIIIK